MCLIFGCDLYTGEYGSQFSANWHCFSVLRSFLAPGKGAERRATQTIDTHRGEIHLASSVKQAEDAVSSARCDEFVITMEM